MATGSLINKQSLLRTVPDATKIRSAYIKNFKQSFNIWDSKGLTDKSHGSLRDQPFCALDVEKSPNDSVNGIIFEMSGSLEEIKAREHMYQLIRTEAFDFKSMISIGQVLVFSAGLNDGSYVFDSPAQTRYLNMCLTGAKTYGLDFYEEFLRTTYIGQQLLSDINIKECL